MLDTRQAAQTMVAYLAEQLQGPPFKAIRSVYICGSYCRGDWLESSSDLDLHTLYDQTLPPDALADDQERLLHLVAQAKEKAGGAFLSHCPGGVDVGYSALGHIPLSQEEAVIPSPYAYFAALLFDLKKHHLTLYGEDITRFLPESVGAWLRYLCRRMEGQAEKDGLKLAAMPIRPFWRRSCMREKKPSPNMLCYPCINGTFLRLA